MGCPAPVKVLDKDISVVVQGPLSSDAQGQVDSIRRVLPKSEIILSTWKGQAVERLSGVDRILLSVPPEPLLDFDGRAYNLSLQMVSTLAGIKEATRAYVYKLRSDHFLADDGLCMAMGEGDDRNPSYAFLKGRIIVSSYFTRDVLKIPVLFHLSDLAQFGRKEDMLDFWSSPLPTHEVLDQEPRGKLFRNLWGYCGAVLLREAAEQHLVLQWLARHGHPVRLPHPCAWDRAWFELWENTLAANFLVIDAERSGLAFPARFRSRSIDRRTLLLQNDFEALRSNPANPARLRRCLMTRYLFAWFLPRYWLVRAYILLFSLFQKQAQFVRQKIRDREAVVG